MRDSFLEESMKGLSIKTVDAVETDATETEGAHEEDGDSLEAKCVDISAEIPTQAETAQQDVQHEECNATSQVQKDQDETQHSSLREHGQSIESSADRSVHPSAVVWPLPHSGSTPHLPESDGKSKITTIPKALMRKGSSYASAVSTGKDSGISSDNMESNVRSTEESSSTKRSIGNSSKPSGLNVNAKPWMPSWER